MVPRTYLARHAAGLLKLASSTSDCAFAAALVEKASELQRRIEHSGYQDLTPQAPDVEPPRPNNANGQAGLSR